MTSYDLPKSVTDLLTELSAITHTTAAISDTQIELAIQEASRCSDDAAKSPMHVPAESGRTGVQRGR